MASSEARRVFFISHRSTEKAHANELRKQLEEFGVVDVWLDTHELKPGDHLSEIGKAIESINVAIVLWSTEASGSEWVNKEIDLAARYDVRTIFCVMDTGVVKSSQELRDRIFINYHFPEVGFARLCMNEVMPLVVDSPGALRLLKEHDAQLAHVTDRLLDPEGFYAHDYWSNEINRVWPALRNAIETAASSRSKSASDCRTFLKVMEKAHEGLAPFLKFGAGPHETMDLADYIDDAGNFVMPAGEIEPRSALRAEVHTHAYEDSARSQIRSGLESVVPPMQLNQAVELVSFYITTSNTNLEVMRSLAETAGSAAGQRIVAELEQYLEDPHDLLPEAQYGAFGKIDDAFLIHNTAYRITEAGLIAPNSFPVDWQAIATTDGLIRSSVLPSHVVMQLEAKIAGYVRMLIQEMQGYTPQQTMFGGEGRFLMNALSNLFD